MEQPAVHLAGNGERGPNEAFQPETQRQLHLKPIAARSHCLVNARRLGRLPSEMLLFILSLFSTASFSRHLPSRRRRRCSGQHLGLVFDQLSHKPLIRAYLPLAGDLASDVGQ